MNLTYLRPLYRQSGPFASVYLDASSDTEDAGKRRDISAKDVADELAAAGADPAIRAAVEAAIRDHTGTGRHGLAVFATNGAVALTQTMDEPPARPVARWGEQPSVLPLLRGTHERVRWLRVQVDRIGGELTLDSGATLRTVRGDDDYPITKAQPGGWSQPRYQRAAEENWDRNAKDVAEAVAQAADEVGAEVVILAGDVRARQLLVEHLPPAVARRVADSEEAVPAAVAHRLAEILDAYRAGRAHGLAVAGVSEVRTPLEWGQVETLLIAPGLPDDTGDGLIAAAVTHDAEVVLVPPEEEPLPEGVGAVLRYRVGPAEGAGDEPAA
ncbi:MAG: hypothetical protein AUG44_24920 [Actinobacteria bacterium 13_1_20CM_3_71_11]|nr:MAG: hypothetical protein AUG44_24920 [Actinobacteria bacterium 13_1_20CM_3_71_11]